MKRWMTVLLILMLAAGGVGGFLWFRSRQANSEEAEIIRTAKVERAN